MPRLMIDGFTVDGQIRGVPEMNSEATEFPVEDGADLTDHVRQLPIEIEIEGIVSDTPIGGMKEIRDAGAADRSAVLGPEQPAQKPSAQALAHFERIRARRLPVTIQTATKLYERMAMIGFSAPSDKQTGKALHFTARFKQIEIRKNERTVVKTATPRGQGTAKGGAKPAQKKEVATVDPVTRSPVIIWRKGVPPGATNDSYIFEQVKQVTTKTPDGKTSSYFEHGPVSSGPDNTGKPLSNDETNAFLLDMKRDQREKEASQGGVSRVRPDGTVDTQQSTPPKTPNPRAFRDS